MMTLSMSYHCFFAAQEIALTRRFAQLLYYKNNGRREDG